MSHDKESTQLSHDVNAPTVGKCMHSVHQYTLSMHCRMILRPFRQCDDPSNILFHKSCPDIYRDCSATCLNIVVDEVHSFMAMVFPN